jgi:hypothetical protein
MRKVVAALAIAASAYCGVALAARGTTTVEADLNGDGLADTITLMQEQEQVTVTARIADSDQQLPQVLAFGVNSFQQDAVCALPATLASAPLVCVVEEEPLPGCREGKNAQGLKLSGGGCDAIYLYWDHQQARLRWWRL